MNCCNTITPLSILKIKEKPMKMSVKRTKRYESPHESNDTTIKSDSIEEMHTALFQLNIDCFEAIFEYLSLKDLHSFGQTCKAMQQMAGGYFHRNFKSAEKFSANDAIYMVYSNNDGVSNERIQTSSFNQFINYISHYYEEMEPLHYIHSHSDEFTAINRIYLVCLAINPTKIGYLQKILSKINVVQLRQCTLIGDFYETLLSHCKQLKRLYVQDDLGDIIDESGNPWLLRQYPTLELFQLTLRYPFRILELSTFFERNPNVRSFSTSSRCLWENRHELLKCKAELDRLEIEMLDNFYRQLIDMQLICELLNQLYERGFYQRLHLFVKRVDQKCSEQLASVYGLECLSIRQFSRSYSLPLLTNLKVLTILNGSNTNDMDILAKNLVNIERICFQNATHSDILPFIRRSVRLNKVKFVPTANEAILKLAKLNVERVKLAGARKITIYVPDNVFLATKWTAKNGEINLNMIEMKRADSYEWDQHY
ncbi:uncharacterized protein LOC129570682 [Sitodiplosis mosellana]|uniref:uncharacterized protein LOC129570682 n=1 Tax=Sitodiplosis mosellana TaxID=263140 RepID=UPI002444F03B|nr:uncharacterized protein LOC129570682 [Sitodiplosis mosellana]XP_055306355.1 uncharacterized protein LOC129570682 [Sitodiplosis mosellana]